MAEAIGPQLGRSRKGDWKVSEAEILENVQETATACWQRAGGGRNAQHQLVPLLRGSVCWGRTAHRYHPPLVALDARDQPK